MRDLYEEALAEQRRITDAHERRVRNINVRMRVMVGLVIALGLLAVFA